MGQLVPRREKSVGAVIARLENYRRLVVLGPAGSGESWLLTPLVFFYGVMSVLMMAGMTSACDNLGGAKNLAKLSTGKFKTQMEIHDGKKCFVGE